ncbi:uncharacterized protein LOC112494366 [Cephus cinctus]|uniref:Uncharacterized protein LOC112494366 n=1 Tax=Cephus cinctus TaxID=211228 RepID=A0AAJ7RH87_CEPCN|nr:uncharacterized protein LOC112494366 [Cephus cinctus]XP_024940871.1 uncharacterized protein LOC112494366 [Cephus cinctus]
MTFDTINNYRGRISDLSSIDCSQDICEDDKESCWDTEDVVDLSCTASGKYEDINPLDMINDESKHLSLADYLYQMNPKQPPKFDRTVNRRQEEIRPERYIDFRKNRSMDPFQEESGKTKFLERSAKMPVQKFNDYPNKTYEIEASPAGTVSVRCTPSSPEIVGTPSEVVIKLNEVMKRYIPQRNGLLQGEINKEVDEVENDTGNSAAQEPKDLEEEEEEDDYHWCPGDLNLDLNESKYPEENRCPGTRDLLSGKKVPCSKARVLREIALGRRIPRTILPPRVPFEEYEDDEDDLIEDEEEEEEEDDCCCAKGGEGRRDSQGRIKNPDFRAAKKKPCCAPRRGNKSSKCVSFAK